VREAAERLHAASVVAARDPALYVDQGAPDTVEARFELLTAHVILLVQRLGSAGAQGAAIRQGLFDAYIGHLDGAMREMGVGDISMGRRMKGLGEAFYGRARAYDRAFARLPDTADFSALIGRSILAGVQADPAPLAETLLRRRSALAAAPDDALLHGEVQWS
jgi:cytochrome b pre-mRNA-processing protein 3